MYVPMTRKTRARSAALAIGLLLAVAALLAACGGDESDQDQQPPPAASDTPSAITSPVPADAPDATNTPVAIAEADPYIDAVAQARGNLAAQLNVSIETIDVLAPETALDLEDPLTCPVPGEALLEEELLDAEAELSDEELDALAATAEAMQDALGNEQRDPGFEIEAGTEEDEPAIPDIDVALNYIFLQHEQTIYPYQYYTWPKTGALVVEQCYDDFVDNEVLYVPTTNPRGSAADRVRDDLRARGIDPSQGTIAAVQAMVWNDTNLGCPVYTAEQREALTPALIDGFLVIYRQGSDTYEFHTDATGEQIILCEPPPAFNTPEDVIAVLLADEDFEVEQSEEETVTYEGLDRDGILIELTYLGYRAGLFGYESQDAARQAAQVVTDEYVSYIFVSGKVLIVLEEDSPEAVGILSNIGELVRIPADELPTSGEDGESFIVTDEDLGNGETNNGAP